ncbi:MAG TPA: carboxylating nicotinate-nucleotide diphosphorylase [Clostridiales bacterium]|nr:carboxylating nicotinate-nucleotide diphosphorylase [Clostridiales bacterium]
MINDIIIDNLIKRALEEDMPFGDITTDALIDEQSISRAEFIAKEAGVIAGLDIAGRVFEHLDGRVIFTKIVRDGDKVNKGDIIAEVEGQTRALLKGERTALNILQRLSGIASKTNEICSKVKDLSVSIADTRKTIPGMRILEKYAVKTGGGSNHRYSLSDGVLIKDNHIAAAGSIKKAVEAAKASVPHTIKIEVETETINQVQEALVAGADIIMLDNMNEEKMREAVKLINKRALVEASGNVSLDNVRQVALTGVDIISIGTLTHSVKALDISMKIR